MPTISEDQLASWTQPAFNNEDEKRASTERMIREAIRGHSFLRTLSIDVYAKGSYRNNTNVRRDSDVDVAVEYEGIVYSDYGPNTSRDEVWRAQGLHAYSGPFRNAATGATEIGRFKNAVGEALVSAFGSSAVTRSNKVFTVRESQRSLAADVVPCATYRKYWSPTRFNQGIRLLPDRWPGFNINNYPQQHYDRGVAKNEATSRRYKSVVRILKNLENRMVADGASPVVASYLIESLTFNVPNSVFSYLTWAARVRGVLSHVWADTEEVECETRWHEANDIKYLFHQHQKWTREEARAFVHAAWQYVADS
jgi:hypothetical protein